MSPSDKHKIDVASNNYLRKIVMLAVKPCTAVLLKHHGCFRHHSPHKDVLQDFAFS